MKKVLILGVLCLLLSACQLKPLSVGVEDNIIVVNNEQYTIADNFQLVAIAEHNAEKQTHRCYMFEDLSLKSWIFVIIKNAKYTAEYYGDGSSKDLDKNCRRFRLRYFSMFDARPWTIIDKRKDDVDLDRFAKLPVDITFCSKLVSQKKSISLYIVSEIDTKSQDLKSHLFDAEKSLSKKSLQPGGAGKS